MDRVIVQTLEVVDMLLSQVLGLLVATVLKHSHNLYSNELIKQLVLAPVLP